MKNLYTGFSLNFREMTTFIYLLLISAFFVLYILLLKNVNFFSKKIKANSKLFIFFLVPLIAYPAILSFDLFNYIATAKILFYYHENPYIIMPIEFINDPVLLFTRAANKVALYGPGWIAISGIPYLLSFGKYILSIYIFKFFISLFYIGAGMLIWKITRSLFSVLLFMASPLIIVETLVSGHNDIVMMFFALLSFYFLRNKRIYFAIFFLLVSILIKYITIFLIPIFIITIIFIYQNKKIDWKNVYFICFLSMLLIFLLAFFREEIYPWYAIWPFSFLVLSPNHKVFLYSFISLTFGLMLSYSSYMYSGSYFGLSHAIRMLFIFFPVVVFFLYYAFRKTIRLI
ncbi:MAG: hypothetical protein AAB531_00150 [Patescibacteria group bacterium]